VPEWFWSAAHTFTDAVSAAKPVAEVVQSALTSIGIVLGAWWVLKKREHLPRASVTHRVQTAQLTDGKLLVHVETTLANVGQRLLQVQSCLTRLQQVRPLTPDMLELLDQAGNIAAPDQTEASWRVLGEHNHSYGRSVAEVEPGESQTFDYDFGVDSWVEVVEVYSYFGNVSKRRAFPNILKRREIGWNKTTLFDVREQEPKPMPSKPVNVRLQEQLPPKPSTDTITDVRQLPLKVATPAVEKAKTATPPQSKERK
jgi:hypothetical protein